MKQPAHIRPNQRQSPHIADGHPTGESHGSARALDRSLISGIAWTGAGKWGTQVLTWASTLIVARLLSPSDFGLVGMAMVYMGLVQLVNEFGLGSAIVQNRSLTSDQLSRLGGLSILLAGGFCLLSLLLARPVAGFFGEPAVQPAIMVLSITFLAGGLQLLPRSLLTRELQFRKLAFVEMTEAIGTMVVTLTLAILGFGFWSLIFGAVVGKIGGTALTVFWRRHTIRWPSEPHSLKQPLLFGTHMVVANLAFYVYSSADLVIIGRLFGNAALGAYGLAVTIATMPVEKVSALMGRVVLPVFATIQKDLPALRRYILRLTEATSLITFPAAIGIALVADYFVIGILGEPWTAAIVPLRLLALGAAFRSISPVMAHVLVAMGYPERNMRFSVTTALLMPLLFIAGARWGTAGVALVWMVGHPAIVTALFFRSVFRSVELSVASYLKALRPAASACFAMAVVLLALRWVLPASGRAIVDLAIHVSVGAGVYSGVAFVLHRDRLRDFLGYLRSTWKEA